MAKKTIKEMLKPASITISFTREEVRWLADVVNDALDVVVNDASDDGCVGTAATRRALKEFIHPVFQSACEKIIDAEELLQNVDKVIHERTKVRKVDARKRQASGARRKGTRR